MTALNTEAMAGAKAILDTRIKPPHSLGTLEDIALQLAGITGQVHNTMARKIICLFAADNGVFAEGVCSSPQSFTRGLMKVYAESKDGGINVLSREAGAELRLYDLGVKGLAPHPAIITRKFLPEGTANFLHGRAMSLDITEKVIAFGKNLVGELKCEGFGIIGTGEAGMANTTTACACIMAAAGSRDPSLVGRGAGLSDEALSRKKQVILSGLALHAENLTDPINILSCVGGLDLAAMTGVFLGGAQHRVPIIIDGVISIAAALMACRINPDARDFMIASHESPEPAYSLAAKLLGLKAPLKLGMRLGEGTGCAVMMKIIDCALAIINGMGGFDSLKGDSS